MGEVTDSLSVGLSYCTDAILTSWIGQTDTDKGWLIEKKKKNSRQFATYTVWWLTVCLLF